MNASAIVNRINTAMSKISYGDRTAYLRIITRTGGDDLIGRPGKVSYTDTVISPPPVWARVGRYIVGDSSHAEALRKGSFASVADGYMFVFSPSAVPLATLQNPDAVIVLKDSAMNEEVYRVTDIEPIGMSDEDIVIIVYAKSTSRE